MLTIQQAFFQTPSNRLRRGHWKNTDCCWQRGVFTFIFFHHSVILYNNPIDTISDWSIYSYPISYSYVSVKLYRFQVRTCSKLLKFISTYIF